jgi:hypothetical protein
MPEGEIFRTMSWCPRGLFAIDAEWPTLAGVRTD